MSDSDIEFEGASGFTPATQTGRNKRKRFHRLSLSPEYDEDNPAPSAAIETVRQEFENYFGSISRQSIKVKHIDDLRSLFYKALAVAADAVIKHTALQSSLESADKILSSQNNEIQNISECLRDSVLPMLGVISKMSGAPPSSDAPSQTKPSFANIVRRKPNKQFRQPDHPLIICPKQKQSATNTRQDITSLIDPVTEQIGVTRMREARDGQCVVALHNPEDMEKLKLKLTNDRAFRAQYDVREPRKRNPRVIFKGVPKDLSDEAFAEALYQHNPEISDSISDETRFKSQLRFLWHSDFGKSTPTKDARKERNIVVEVPPLLRKILIKLQRVKVQWQMISVDDHLLVTRCFNCCGLGHRSSGKTRDGKTIKCPHNSLVCSHCAGNHTFKNCPTKDDTTSTPKCHNCTSENARLKNNRLKTDHNAFSQNCPSLTRYLQAEYDKTDYGF